MTYSNARDLASATPSDPIVDVVGPTSDCGGQTGSFLVRDIAFGADGVLSRLDASITYVCNLRPSVPGRIEYRLFTDANPVKALVHYPNRFGPRNDPSSGGFPTTLVGAQSVERFVDFKALGAVSITIDAVRLGGPNAADWTVTTDTCSGATVPVGSACQVGVRLTPTVAGNLDAMLQIDSDATTGQVQMAVQGSALWPTTTTLTLLRNPNYLPDSPRVRVVVAPNPGGGEVCAVEPGVWKWKCVPIGSDGSATFDANYMATWTGQLIGHFAGFGLSAGSQSANQTQEQRNGSVTTLISATNPQEVTKPIVLTATASRDSISEPLTAGILTIRDETTGVTLGTKDVSRGPTLIVSVPMSLGSHDIVARYSGHDGGANNLTVGPSQAALTQSVIADTRVDLSGTGVDVPTFYPAVDGYRDAVFIRGLLGERASVTIKIVSKATGKTVRTEALGSLRTGRYGWSWDGRNASGTLQALGGYTIEQSVVDGAGNRTVVMAQTTLAKGTIAWKTVTVTQNGSAFAASGAASGGYAGVGGTYTRGASLNSGGSSGGYAALVYAFTGPTAVAYRTVTFRVYGRPTVGPRGWLGVANPSLGSIFDLEAYDVWARTGTAYGAHIVTATGEDHRSGRTVAGLVETRFERRLGGLSSFDVEKVQMTIVYGSWAP